METQTTIVSAYFAVKSKNPHERYVGWMQNFLLIQKPMVIFTDNPELIEEHRPIELMKWTEIIPTAISDFYVYKYVEHFQKDAARDHENQNRYKHTPELYMIWNEKTNFVRRAIELNPFNSTYFYWTDIGAFRNRQITEALYLQYPKRTTDKVLLLCLVAFRINEIPKDEDDITERFRYVNRMGGGMFGGHRDYILQWWDKYYEMLDKFVEKDLFAGKDQSIMATTALLNQDIVQIIRPNRAQFDPWFYIQEYLTL